MQDLTKMSDEELVAEFAAANWVNGSHDDVDTDENRMKAMKYELLRRLKSAHIRSDSDKPVPFTRCLGCARLFEPTDIRICDPHDDNIHRCVGCHAAKFGTLPEWAKPSPGHPCKVCGRGVWSEGAD